LCRAAAGWWLLLLAAAFYCSHTSRAAAEPELLRHIPSPIVSVFYFLLWRLDPLG